MREWGIGTFTAEYDHLIIPENKLLVIHAGYEILYDKIFLLKVFSNDEFRVLIFAYTREQIFLHPDW